MMNSKSNLSLYVSNKTARNIVKNKKLLSDLSIGIDIRGTLFLLNKDDSSDLHELTKFIKDIGGFITPYSIYILIVLSEILSCYDIQSVEKKVIDFLENKKLPYVSEQEEVLFGAFDSPNPIIAGGVLNKMMLNLQKDSNL